MTTATANPAIPAAPADRRARFDSDDSRWQAVLDRDRRADGRFVYAVRTTGIFCRPACASRRASRHNVTFYDTPAAAKRDGFRPCKRCTPDQASAPSHTQRTIEAACAILMNADQAPDLATLAAASGMSPSHFHRTFKRTVGVTPKEFALGVRAARTRAAAQSRPSGSSQSTDRRTTKQITARYGESSSASDRWYGRATSALGMTPHQFARGGVGTRILFAVGVSSLGPVLIAATQRGVCAITMGDDPDDLVRGLERQFPRAELIGGDAAFETVVARVIALIEKPAAACPLPLEVRGTAFQHRVWRILRKIPRGSTRSYAEIARAIGTPNAARAVALACAANTIAIAIPCHRVVRTDASLSGYRWGVDRKAALLARERPAAD